MDDRPVIAWFERDLRLADQPMLSAAVASGRPVLPVFILDDVTPARWKPGAAARWWLHHSLSALAADLARIGLPLVLRRGDGAEEIARLVEESGAGAVLWSRRYEPALRLRDTALKAALRARGTDARSFAGALLREPWEVQTTAGNPYRVFTPFWRALQAMGAPSAALPAPQAARAPARSPPGDNLEAWDLVPRAPDWAGGLRDLWTPGESGAQARLSAFLDEGLAGYRRDRDRPDRPGTSMLSPHLHLGEVSPRAVWHAVAARIADSPAAAGDGEAYLRELGWREFSAHLLFAEPDLPLVPLRPEFSDFPWRPTDAHVRAWRCGATGFPIVDAGMRQLWATGWMHNRVRMVVASFLVKDLATPWQDGEAWFWDTLVDADLANNAASWQWVAGCGADAAPFFRIFNPVLQGEKFDPDGAYVRRWVPELARLPARYLHAPWKAPAAALAEAGVRLGESYARPIVDHATARRRALEAFASLRPAAH
ncbi:MAG: deoxyribodipyrimidine photo-lyase [Alphaproteobacteria bacterium]